MPPTDAVAAQLDAGELDLYEHAEQRVAARTATPAADAILDLAAARAEATLNALTELAAHRAGLPGQVADTPEPDPKTDRLDGIRAAILDAMATLATDADLDAFPLGVPSAPSPASRMRHLAAAYRDLGGPLDLPLTPLAAQVGHVEANPPPAADRVAEHAVKFVADLPGLPDALGHADVLYAELAAITDPT